MSARPPARRGWWLVSAVNPLLFALGIRGFLGPEAQAESETARDDWRAPERSPLPYAIVFAVVAVAAAAIIASHP